MKEYENAYKICAIILTKNEDLHLRRILDQLLKLADHILIVDSDLMIKPLKLQKNINVN